MTNVSFKRMIKCDKIVEKKYKIKPKKARQLKFDLKTLFVSCII